MLQPCSRLEHAVLQVILRKQGDCSLRTCVCSSFNDWGCSVCSGVVVTIGAEADQRRRLNDSVCLQVINGANESKLLVADRIRNRLVEWCVHEACNLAEAIFKIIGGQGAPVIGEMFNPIWFHVGSPLPPPVPLVYLLMHRFRAWQCQSQAG